MSLLPAGTGRNVPLMEVSQSRGSTVQLFKDFFLNHNSYNQRMLTTSLSYHKEKVNKINDKIRNRFRCIVSTLTMRTSPIIPPSLLCSSSSNALLCCSDRRRLQAIKPTIIPRTRIIANTMRTMIHVAKATCGFAIYLCVCVCVCVLKKKKKT